MKTYRIWFERIGRTHLVPPLITEADSVEQLTDNIQAYGRRYLNGTGTGLTVSTVEGWGEFLCGDESGGTFRIERVPAGGESRG